MFEFILAVMCRITCTVGLKNNKLETSLILANVALRIIKVADPSPR